MLYSCYGLTISSEIPLPLAAAEGNRRADFEVCDVATEAPPLAPIGTFGGVNGERVPWGFAVEDEEVNFWFGDAGTMRVDCDRRVIEADGSGRRPRVAACVVSTGLACLVSTMGYLVLHAASVVRDGSAVAICGRSGRGKSTAAVSLALARRGWSVLHDDVTVLSLDHRAQPGPPYAELRADTARGLGIPCAGGKVTVPLGAVNGAPMRALVLLEPRGLAPAARILGPAEAAARLGCDAGWWGPLTPRGRTARFAMIADLVDAVPCLAWSPPEGIATATAALCEILEDGEVSSTQLD